MPLPEDPIKSFRGLLKDYPLVDELLKSRKKEANLKLKTNSAL
jgi:hypothetical protein